MAPDRVWVTRRDGLTDSADVLLRNQGDDCVITWLRGARFTKRAHSVRISGYASWLAKRSIFAALELSGGLRNGRH